jgi:hypothetical protein
MWLFQVVLLLLLGLIGCAGWIRRRRPSAGEPLRQLESVEGWIGLVGLVWGLVLLIRWLASLGLVVMYPLVVLFGLVTVLVVLALSFAFVGPLLGALLGEHPARAHVDRVHRELDPHRVELGFACLALAAYTLVRVAF